MRLLHNFRSHSVVTYGAEVSRENNEELMRGGTSERSKYEFFSSTKLLCIPGDFETGGVRRRDVSDRVVCVDRDQHLRISVSF